MKYAIFAYFLQTKKQLDISAILSQYIQQPNIKTEFVKGVFCKSYKLLNYN